MFTTNPGTDICEVETLFCLIEFIPDSLPTLLPDSIANKSEDSKATEIN